MQFTPISSLATAFVFVLTLLFLPSLDQQSGSVDADQAKSALEWHAASLSEVTPVQAHAMMNAQPDILFIDVRDPVEIARSGHPGQIDAIVPIMLQSEQNVSGAVGHKMVKNPRFLTEMGALRSDLDLSADHEILLFGGHGPRVLDAAAKLDAAGYSNVKFIVEDASASVTPGTDPVDTWKSHGLPWAKTPVIWGSEWRIVLESPALHTRNASAISFAKIDPHN